MSDSEEKKNFIIQISYSTSERAKNAAVFPSLKIEEVEELLDGTGVEIDRSYGPYCVNPKECRFVVRGRASEEARAKTADALGDRVKFFADSRVQTPSTPEAGGKKPQAKGSENGVGKKASASPLDFF